MLDVRIIEAGDMDQLQFLLLDEIQNRLSKNQASLFSSHYASILDSLQYPHFRL